MKKRRYCSFRTQRGSHPIWTGAAGEIWGLVAGFAPELMKRRLMTFLTAVFDDCGTGGGDREPVFVLSGYVASAQAWAEFAVDWDALCKKYHIEPFKMHVAADRWLRRGTSNPSPPELEPLKLFYRTIERFALSEARLVVPYDAFNKAVARCPFQYEGTVYLFAFRRLFEYLAQQREHLKIEEKVDLIFDRGTFPRDVIHQDWDKLLETASPSVRELLGDPPKFLDDCRYLPLQAADFSAWWTLDGWRNPSSYNPAKRYPWEPSNKGIPGFEAAYDEETVINILCEAGRNTNPGSVVR